MGFRLINGKIWYSLCQQYVHICPWTVAWWGNPSANKRDLNLVPPLSYFLVTTSLKSSAVPVPACVCGLADLTPYVLVVNCMP